MKTVIKVWNKENRAWVDLEVDAIPSPSSVLCVHKNTYTRGWNVTHVSSGAKLAVCRGKDAALEVMTAFAPAEDDMRQFNAAKPCLSPEAQKICADVLRQYRANGKIIS
jgi:hypothetical protein